MPSLDLRSPTTFQGILVTFSAVRHVGKRMAIKIVYVLTESLHVVSSHENM